jgi:mRNA-degrading endonuclease RelE of RelBE toxin-antitoxin system
MKTAYRESFNRDLQKLKNRKLKESVKNVIRDVELAQNLAAIRNCKKMAGHSAAFRIRVRDYRLGFFFEKDTIEFARFLHRKEAYRYFP